MTHSPVRSLAPVLMAAWLAACSAPPPPAAPVVVAVTASRSVQPEIAAPPLPAPSTVTVTGSSRSLVGMPAPPPYLIPSGDRFPDSPSNKLQLTEEHPVSTFSVDVDTASYAYMRRLLADGRMPPPDAVRVEEMVNYFPYQYPRPASRTTPFALTTELMPNPWNARTQLLHIGLRGFDTAAVNAAAARPPINAVLLIDVSGSMQPSDRLPLLQQGFRLFADQLREQDRVAIVTYASGTRVVLEPTSGRDKHKIVEAIDALSGGGGTGGDAGLQQAYALAERHFDPKAVNRIILATDGDFNLGITDPRQLEKFVADKRKSGVYLSILGVGMGNLNDALMQRLSQSGNGNAAYVDSLLEARKALGEQFASTMFPIANDVKMQVEFNPARVAAYRLIGYETRMLARQDFNDDRIDAGDMGAGHTVTAIYEITPVGTDKAPVDPLRYERKTGDKPAAKGDELCFVKARYKLPGQTESRLIEHPVRATALRKSIDAAPGEQRFAIAVAAFGQRLRGEAQLGGYGYRQIGELAQGARGEDREGYRAEFVRLVQMAESLERVGTAAR